MGMYSVYKHLRTQHGNLLHRLINLENSLRNFDPKNCYLNVCEREQYSVELDGETGKKIIQNEIKEMKDKLTKVEFELIHELEIILAKKKMIKEPMEEEKSPIDELFGEEGE